MNRRAVYKKTQKNTEKHTHAFLHPPFLKGYIQKNTKTHTYKDYLEKKGRTKKNPIILLIGFLYIYMWLYRHKLII